MLKFAMKGVRQVVRGLGFDLVRFNELPTDLDPTIAEIVSAVKPYTMTSIQRLIGLCEAVRYLVRNRIAGDIVECGVWRGGSMMAVARTLVSQGETSRSLHLFDTFAGMTEPSERDVSLLGQSASHLMRTANRSEESSVWCLASIEEVQHNMASTGYPRAQVHYVQGRVEETIPKHAPQAIALLRLDTDWYESTRHELEHLFPLLVRGGVLILDDYGHWKGAKEAVDEYFAKLGRSPLLQRLDYSGRLAIKVD
jgi:hypothetical protein